MSRKVDLPKAGASEPYTSMMLLAMGLLQVIQGDGSCVSFSSYCRTGDRGVASRRPIFPGGTNAEPTAG